MYVLPQAAAPASRFPGLGTRRGRRSQNKLWQYAVRPKLPIGTPRPQAGGGRAQPMPSAAYGIANRQLLIPGVNTPFGPAAEGALPPGYNPLSGDPFLNQQMGLYDNAMSRARAGLDETRRSQLLRLGSRSLAEQVLGVSDPILAQISDDPDKSFSTLAMLKRWGRETRTEQDIGMNQGNLWFSSTRGKALSDLAYEQLLRENQATTNTQDVLSQALREYNDRVFEIEQAKLAAEMDAYYRSMGSGLFDYGDYGMQGQGTSLGQALARSTPGSTPRGMSVARRVFRSPRARLRAPVRPIPRNRLGSRSR